jgi:hypothetical protein
MARRTTEHIITGFDPHLRMCFYHSPHFGQNIWRRGSSLTGERTKTDPAFKGFRQSSSRLKEASPIAASLYKLIPKEQKEYALYRTLTGEAIKMLKENMEAVVIAETLKTIYIDPLLQEPKKISPVEEPVMKDRVKGMNDFTSYSPITGRNKKITRTRRSFLLQKIIAGESTPEHFLFAASSQRQQTSRSVSDSISGELNALKQRTKTTDGLIYLGRLPECKKLKMWLRPPNVTLSDQ